MLNKNNVNIKSDLSGHDTNADKHAVLRRYFGYTSFRSGQDELTDAILAGRDALGIMPTGGGKSICYQVPAMLLPGMTFVISPLISLMKDQVMTLKNAGIKAAYINSSLTPEQLRQVLQRLGEGEFKIVYIAPERLNTEQFLSVCTSISANLPISLVAVDEAHCISQWGQDFRPSYLRIINFLNRLPRRPIIAAFTATATARVQQDIETSLQMKNPVRIITGFDRPNLHFAVLRPKDKNAALLKLLQKRRGKSGIIYCSTRNNVEKVCDALRKKGILATRYHAGLSDEERRRNQEYFIYDKSQIMVATNAFGMGIDKSNVSFVIHYNMPKSIEAYYQEAGRAGRDGEKADCILLYSAGDIYTARFLIQSPGNNENLSEDERRTVIEQDMARLDTMIGYCKTTGCLRRYILDYFGQQQNGDCGNCGNCHTVFTTQDVTTEAQMILSCIRRAYDKTGSALGATSIISILRGSRQKKLLDLHLDEISTYGLLPNTDPDTLRSIIEHLETEGYLRYDPMHRTIRLSLKAADILFDGARVVMPVPVKQEPAIKHPDNPNTGQDTDTPLLDAMKELRLKLAQQQNVPAYIVFSNATLVDMAIKMPQTMDELLNVSGVGEVKAKLYGRQFLALIQKYL